MENKLKVSICVVTYNQEKYIAECLQSLVDQETDFKFEIVVSDDCSTDDTRKIISDFSERYPGMFRLFLHEENMGALKNFKFVHDQAAGEYVAHMDGDDYALPGKLQAQADLLDKDKSCNLVWTPILSESAPGHLHEQNLYFKNNALNRSYTRADLIKYGAVGTNSSKMYRKLPEVDLFLAPDFEIIDCFMNVIQVGDGVARFVGYKPLGVYRLGIGIASHGSGTQTLTLQSIDYFSKMFPEYRLQCNIAAGFHLLRIIKNKRPGFLYAFNVFFRSFHWKVFFHIVKEYKFVMSLTVKDKI